MALNETFRDADHLSLPVPSGVKSGDPVAVGAIVGVAQTHRGGGGNATDHATVWTKGAFDLPVTGAVENVGAPVYIADGALTATAPATDPVIFGYALATQAADGTITVKIAQV